ncbi:MAG: coproporphyrinogen dehydrogenase HemZ [Clostridia bacterium]|nr:coproporphyrinogen dehydrogenase HemZ [Clostridia bacterium]
MYKIILEGTKNKYDYEELVKVFLRPDMFVLVSEAADTGGGDDDAEYEKIIRISADSKEIKNLVKQKLYKELVEITGFSPEWGILTGVRPVKIARMLMSEHKSYKKAFSVLTDFYYLSEKKAELILDTYLYQHEALKSSPKDAAGVYIGIPFCPTRCLYCSFASNQVADSEIERYLQALYRETDAVGAMMKEKNIIPESLYIGGGTPTTLDERQLAELLDRIYGAFDMSAVKEFTVEAGRPDTITEGKLKVIEEKGAGRISINPQTMKDSTLELIGRNHTAGDIRNAFKMAARRPALDINTDVIAGLPGETPKDFEATLSELTALRPANITVHTLAVKRASRLIDVDPDFHYKQGETVREMLVIAEKMLRSAGYRPYYLYRQKHMAGAYENTGWCLDGCESIYNIRIMDESQSIVALGAGGISKAYFPEEDRLERVPNVTNYEQYIDRIDEMIERKRINLFGEGKKC